MPTSPLLASALVGAATVGVLVLVVRALLVARAASRILEALGGAPSSVRAVLREAPRMAVVAGRFVDTGGLVDAPIAGKPVLAYRLTVRRRGRKRFEDLSVASARLSDGTGVMEVVLDDAVPTPELEVEGRFTRAPAALEHRLKARYPDRAGWFEDPDVTYQERAVGPDDEVVIVGRVARRPRVRLDAWWVARASGEQGRAALTRLVVERRRRSRLCALVLLVAAGLAPVGASRAGLVDWKTAAAEARSVLEGLPRVMAPSQEASKP